VNTRIPINSIRVAALATFLLLPCITVACTYLLDFSSPSVVASGGSATLPIYTQPGCVWSVDGGHAWLSIVGARQGHGHSEITLNAAPNRSRQAPAGFLSVLRYIPQQGDCLNRTDVSRPIASVSSGSTSPSTGNSARTKMRSQPEIRPCEH
jgi:hypothetical protein